MRWLIALLLLLWSAAAQAQSQGVNVIDISTACGTVGGTAVLVVPAVGDTGHCTTNNPTARTSLFLANASASGGNSISCGYNASITLNGLGTFTLAPLSSAFWPAESAPHQAIWCIAAGAGTLMQIVIGQ